MMAAVKKSITATLVIFIVLLLSGCYFFPKEEEAIAPPLKEPEKIKYDTVVVKRGTVEKTTSCTGYFISSAQTNLAFKYRGGYLKTLNVETGSGVRLNHNDLENKQGGNTTSRDGKRDFKVRKGDILAELDTDNLKNEIRLQEVRLEKAQLAYERLKTIQDIQEGGDKYQLRQCELDMREAQISLDNLRTELYKSKLISPVDGVVDYIDDIKVGDFIGANKTIIRIIDPKQLILEAGGEHTAGLKFGMGVDVEIKGRAYKGEVVMAPYDISAKDYERVRDFGSVQEYAKMLEKMQNTVRVKVLNMPEDTVIGDSAKISAALIKRENVLTLPKNMIHTFDNRKFVKLLKNNVVYERDVELGLESVTEYEIVKGLEEGDRVVR